LKAFLSDVQRSASSFLHGRAAVKNLQASLQPPLLGSDLVVFVNALGKAVITLLKEVRCV
jgi:hypothetical protein